MVAFHCFEICFRLLTYLLTCLFVSVFWFNRSDIPWNFDRVKTVNQMECDRERQPFYIPLDFNIFRKSSTQY